MAPFGLLQRPAPLLPHRDRRTLFVPTFVRYDAYFEGVCELDVSLPNPLLPRPVCRAVAPGTAIAPLSKKAEREESMVSQLLCLMMDLPSWCADPSRYL